MTAPGSNGAHPSLKPITELDAILADLDAEVLIVPDLATRDRIQPILDTFLCTVLPGKPAEVDLTPLETRSVVIFEHDQAPIISDYLPNATTITPFTGELKASHLKTHIQIERERLKTGYEMVRRNIPAPSTEPPPPEPAHPSDADADPIDSRPAGEWPFKILGHNQGVYFYLPFKTQQIVQLTAATHTKLNLMALAPVGWWGSIWQCKAGVDWTGAGDALLRLSEQAGMFTGSNLRGRGCWIDTPEGEPPRVVFHAGDRLMVGRCAHAIAGFNSKYLYQRGEAVSTDDTPPATAAEARKLIDLCDLLTWSTPMSGRLLAGWCCAATVCGALNWRPHIWLHGAPKTGKSWALSNIVIPILGSFALQIQGASSEAGIRQKLQIDARPVVFDEAESEDDRGRSRLKAIMDLARQSSTETGGVIVKGTIGGSAMEFNVRSAFCFSSTGYAPTQQADLSRITRLSLHLKPGQAERYAKCRALRAETVGRPEFCAALRNRVIGQAAQIRANAGTFATAIAAHLGDQRVGDQLGAIISGAYSLASSSLVTPEQAAQWVMRQDWGEFQTLDIDRDENQALSLLLNAHVNIRTGSTNETTSVDALASHYFKADSSQIDREDAHDALLLYGLKITDKGLFVHNSHRQLAAMFKDTPWSGKWKDQLARVPDASEHSGTRFGSDRARSVFLPRSIFIQEKPEGEAASVSADDELPF